MKEGPAHDLRALPPFHRPRFPGEVGHRGVGAALRRPRCAGRCSARSRACSAGDDRDAIDEVAIPIVAVSMLGVAADDVVGTVRIHEAEPGAWWGSRLAVAADYRKVGALGAALIKLAVSSAHARGCTPLPRPCAGAERPAVPPAALEHRRGEGAARPPALSDAGGPRSITRRSSTPRPASAPFRGRRPEMGALSATALRPSPPSCASPQAWRPRPISASPQRASA